MNAFDLQLYSLYIEAGQEQSDLPGMLVVSAPKKASRNRTEDMLAMLLCLGGTVPFTPGYLNDLLQQAAGEYFASQGSVTSGMRLVAEFLNETLLNLNLKSNSEGQQATATLNFSVQHDNAVFIAHAGSPRSFFIHGPDVEILSDESSTSHPLGIAKSVSLRFFQMEAQPESMLIFTPIAPDVWTSAYLSNASQLSLDALRRRLLNQAGTDLRAVIIRFAQGKGQIYRRKLIEPSALPIETSTPAANEQVVQPQQLPLEAALPEVVLAPVPPFNADEEIEPEQEKASAGPLFQQTAAIPSTGNSIGTRPPRAPGKLRQKLASIWLGMKRIRHKVDSGARKVTARVAPRLSVKKSTLPTSTMLFIAIVIPLVIVAIGAAVYIQRGRRVQHDYYIQQAQEMAAYAQAETDHNLQLIYWQQAMAFLLQAEDNGKTEQSKSMHDSIQANLDSLQGVIRIQLQPAVFEGIPNTVTIIKVVSNYDGLYLLDSSVGRIIHLTRRDQYSFEVDYDFACGPVGGTLTIGPLVDMITLPINNIELEPDKPASASVMGIDASGSVLYCASGKNPVSRTLPAPNVGWGHIQAIAMNEDDGALYVLDIQTNRVWMFESEGYLYNTAPESFFDKELPKDFASLISIAVNGHDLYLLHSNNQMARCFYSGLKEIKGTECPNDPAIYQDMRMGGAAQSLSLQGIQFSQMQLIRLPDSAIYLLNTMDPSLYKFGFQLNLYKQLQFGYSPEYPIPNQLATGFGISNDQLVFIAYANQLYFGQIP